MTRNTITLKLTCRGRELILGPGHAADVTKVTGLEASEINVGLSDLATVPGASLDGVHVKSRPIHIEGSFRSSRDTETDRERLIRFFSPNATGWLDATVGSRTRSIAWLLEGWSLKERRTLDQRVGFIADLICPEPYMLGPEVVRQLDGPGSISIANDGDAPAGWTADITGELSGPRIQMGAEYVAAQAGIRDGQTLTISTEPRHQTLTLDGASIFSLIDRGSTPFQIPIGGAVLNVSAETSSATMSTVIRFRERFNGV